MGDLRDTLKRNLGYYLQLNGMSQKELADSLGVSQSAVTNWIKGKNSPDIDLIANICDVFGVEITDLMGIKKTPSFQDEDATKTEIDTIYYGLNNSGQREMLDHARYINSKAEYKKGDESGKIQRK